jgi:inosine-uridine nucleoside N-ribohydrolase
VKNPDRSASCSRSRIVPLVLATLVAACTGTGSPSPATSQRSVRSLGPNATDGPRAVVIDTDMAADDWLAILYLLGRPGVNVKAITVTGAGEAHCGPGVRNALGLVALAGQPDIPVACGREKPLAGDHAFPASWRDGVDTLLGLSLPENPNRPAPDSAAQLLAATLRSSPDRVTLLTLGPLTNPAELLRDSPELADRIGALYVMGGAVDVEGNVGVSGVGIENRFAEWNVYVDPVAANLLLSSGIPVTLVPLDATNHAPVTTAFAERFAGDVVTPQAAFSSDVLSRLRDAIDSGGYYFWDPLAAAMIDDESLASFDSRALAVDTDEGPESGRVISSGNSPMTRFATSADLQRFEQLFLDTLNGRAR